MLLDRVHVLVAEPEMMANFVDLYVADEMLELFAILDPLVEDSAPKQSDAVGQGAALLDAALAERNALVNPGQVERMIDLHFGKQRLVGEVLDLKHDAAKVRRERLRQACQCSPCNRLNLVKRRGMIEAACHASSA